MRRVEGKEEASEQEAQQKFKKSRRARQSEVHGFTLDCYSQQDQQQVWTLCLNENFYLSNFLNY